jgi:hypothetical protein
VGAILPRAGWNQRLIRLKFPWVSHWRMVESEELLGVFLKVVYHTDVHRIERQSSGCEGRVEVAV